MNFDVDKEILVLEKILNKDSNSLLFAKYADCLIENDELGKAEKVCRKGIKNIHFILLVI